MARHARRRAGGKQNGKFRQSDFAGLLYVLLKPSPTNDQGCLRRRLDLVSLGTDIEAPAGFAFQTGQSVVSNHLQEETRFRTPQLFSDHGIKRAINVVIRRGGEGETLFGVLESDSSDERRAPSDALSNKRHEG